MHNIYRNINVLNIAYLFLDWNAFKPKNWANIRIPDCPMFIYRIRYLNVDLQLDGEPHLLLEYSGFAS